MGAHFEVVLPCRALRGYLRQYGQRWILVHEYPWRWRSPYQPSQYSGPELDFNLCIALLRPCNLAFDHGHGFVTMALPKTVRAPRGGLRAIREHANSPSTDSPARIEKYQNRTEEKRASAQQKGRAPRHGLPAFSCCASAPPGRWRRQSCSDHSQSGSIVN